MAVENLQMECNAAIDHNGLVNLVEQSEYYKDPNEKAHLNWIKNVSEQMTDKTSYLPLTLGKCPRGQISLEGKTCFLAKMRVAILWRMQLFNLVSYLDKLFLIQASILKMT